MSIDTLNEHGWSSAELEEVGACPLCSSNNRQKIYSDLEDHVFGCAGKGWDIYQCQACGHGFIDPRPTRESIGRAYAEFYTHASKYMVTRKQRFMLSLANGWRNYKLGLSLKPASRMGIILGFTFPMLAALAESRMRELGRPAGESRLLDVGCGNGDFMMLAESAGWACTGIEPDANSAKLAKGRGLEVRNSTLEASELPGGYFDVVTISHVLEHVHDVREASLELNRLLKPGGKLWLQVPNIESIGHRIFGESWLGLDAPRHLHHFTCAGVEKLLSECGFSDVQHVKHRYETARSMSASQRLAIRSKAHSVGITKKLALLWQRMSANRKADRDVLERDFITITARKA